MYIPTHVEAEPFGGPTHLNISKFLESGAYGSTFYLLCTYGPRLDSSLFQYHLNKKKLKEKPHSITCKLCLKLFFPKSSLKKTNLKS